MSISIGVGMGTPFAVSPYSDISNVTASWKAIGGCWQLTARLTGEDLAGRVPGWLGAKLRHSKWNWYGQIVTVDLTVGRAKRRFDLLQHYANRVVTIIGDTSIETWQENDRHMDRYGTYELVLEGDAGINGTQADDWASRTLNKRKATIPYGLGINKDVADTHVVDITAIGYLPLSARIKNNYTAGSDRIGIDISGLADQQISTVIDDLCSNWSDDLLTPQAITENTTTVDQDLLEGKNTWALLQELAAWDDDVGYRLDTAGFGNVRYYAVTSSEDDPDYNIYHDHVRAHGGATALEPGLCRPGWYRDIISGVTMYGHEIRAREGQAMPQKGQDMPEIMAYDVDVDVFLEVTPPVPVGEGK